MNEMERIMVLAANSILRRMLMTTYGYTILALSLALLMTGCNNNTEPNSGAKAKSKSQPTGLDWSAFYKGCEKDIELLRKTYKLARPPLRASSPEACHAAARIFAKIKFEGMTKDEVLSLLGDPATISDYGIRAKPGPDEPLVYRFDTGLGGLEYTLQFRKGKVVAVKTGSLY